MSEYGYVSQYCDMACTCPVCGKAFTWTRAQQYARDSHNKSYPSRRIAQEPTCSQRCANRLRRSQPCPDCAALRSEYNTFRAETAGVILGLRQQVAELREALGIVAAAMRDGWSQDDVLAYIAAALNDGGGAK